MVQEIQEKQSLGNYLILEGRAHGSYEYPDTLIAKRNGRKHRMPSKQKENSCRQ